MKTLYYKFMAFVVTWLLRLLPRNAPVVYKGINSALVLCEQVAVLGFTRVLIVTDDFLGSSGILDGIKSTLTTSGVEFVVFDGVLPDPAFDQVQAGEAVYRSEGCQAVIAVGGGSVLDAAKMIAMLHTNPGPLKSFDGIQKCKKPGATLFAIPTTAGTGSEITLAAIITDPVSHRKIPVVDSKMIPGYVALDAEIMKGMPPGITAATGMDALTHAVEAYLSANALPETDAYALAATRLIMENLPRAVAKGKDLEARQAMSFASYYAALAFTRAGVGYVHAISHNFGAYYHTPHGLANAIVMPYVLEYSKPKCIRRLADLAEAAGLKEKGDRRQALASKFIERIRAMNEEFDIPDELEALKRSDIPAIARSALKEAHFTYAVPRYMDQPACEKLISRMLA